MPSMATATTASLADDSRSFHNSSSKSHHYFDDDDAEVSPPTTKNKITKSILKPSSHKIHGVDDSSENNKRKVTEKIEALAVGETKTKNTNKSSNKSSSQQQPIYYFGYGPICHSVVRHRRGIPIASVEAAVLHDHRLTFAFGGVVNVVKQRGYAVYGVLLQFDSIQDWNHFQAFDVNGGYKCRLLPVVPLNKTPDSPTTTAYTFVMEVGVEDDGTFLEQQTEKLPQERYLRLIAEGLRQLHIDDPDYVDDQIMSVPYVPKTKPEDYQAFPVDSSSVKKKGVLPKISMTKYQALCKKAPENVAYFILGNKVLKVVNEKGAANAKKNSKSKKDVTPKKTTNPCFSWVKSKAHGQPDSTLLLHKMIVDPDLEMVDTIEELTDEHYQWAENHMYEYLQQSGSSGGNTSGDATESSTDGSELKCTVVYELVLEPLKKKSLWSRIVNGRTKSEGEAVSTSASASLKSAPEHPILRSIRSDEPDEQDSIDNSSQQQNSVSSDNAQHHISNTRRKRRIRKEDVDAKSNLNDDSKNSSSKSSDGDEETLPPTSSIFICEAT